MGSCWFAKCSSTSANGTTLSFYEAGRFSVQGFAMPISFQYGGGTYYGDRFTSALWTASQPVTATVIMDFSVVPSVTLDLTAPDPITVTAPVATGSASLKISKAANLVVTWTGGVEGTIEVELTNDNAGLVDIFINCSAAAAAGTLTVPSAFLAALGTRGTFSAGAQNVTTKQVDDWTMLFTASSLHSPDAVMYTN